MSANFGPPTPPTMTYEVDVSSYLRRRDPTMEDCKEWKGYEGKVFICGVKYDQVTLADVGGGNKRYGKEGPVNYCKALCVERGAVGFFYQQGIDLREIAGFYTDDCAFTRISSMEDSYCGGNMGILVERRQWTRKKLEPVHMKNCKEWKGHACVESISGVKYDQITLADVDGGNKRYGEEGPVNYCKALCVERDAVGFFYHKHPNLHEIAGFYMDGDTFVNPLTVPGFGSTGIEGIVVERRSKTNKKRKKKSNEGCTVC